MKKNLLFLLMISSIVCPLCVMAQDAPEDSAEEGYNPIVFFSGGIVYSKGENVDTTLIRINGSLKVISEGKTYVENSRMKLTGDLINDNTTGNAFLNESPSLDAGYIPGVVEFCGSEPQMITTMGSAYDDSPTKKRNWIGFPSLDINNINQVLIDARMGVKTQDITLTKGWLILDSRLADTALDDPDLNADNGTVSAHLLVEGTVNYNSADWASTATPEERGFIEVRLKVPGNAGNGAKSLIGFGSPFKELRADYFMFNTLLKPRWGFTSGEGFVADKSITDPRTVLQAGHGYALSIDVFGEDPNNYPPKYSGIDFDQRATDGYRFNRSAFAEFAPSNQYGGSDVTAAAYTNEVLNTEDVPLTLQAGYNYLSNPYTCPLDISELIQSDNPNASNPPNYTNGVPAPSWGTDIKVGVLANHPPILNNVWVLNPNSVAAPAGNSINIAEFTYSYYVAANTGGTYTGGYEYDNYDNYDNSDEDAPEPEETLIAPLQMFVIRAYSTVNNPGREFKIPKDARRLGGVPFLRSNTPGRSDDFVFEFRDMETRTSDRLSLVVRNTEELAKNTSYSNIERLETVSVAEDLRSSGGEYDFTQTQGSQVYTKDVSGKPLTVQFLPLESTSSIVLYHIPSSQAQALRIVGLRIGTKDRVQYMWLEDRKEKALTEVKPGMFYETVSAPDDSAERFVLHFNEMTGVEEITPQASIYAHQEGTNIVVTGMTGSDEGNTLNLYDMSGKLLSTKTVAGTKEYFTGSRVGVYVIRMIGSRTEIVKVVAR